MKHLIKAIEYLPDYPGPTEDSEEKVLAEFSHMRPDEEIDAWGMSRATGVEPLTAERVLNQLVQEGLAVKEGNWYSMNIQAQLINKNDNERKKQMVADAYKKAIKQVFKELFEDKEIEASVWAGDPYEWAESALATISFEHGLESPYYDNWLMEKWFEVDDVASSLLPFNVYNELINPGIAGVWEA
jgi:DNA-binding transcriptional regulator YhcF (GntR family)